MSQSADDGGSFVSALLRQSNFWYAVGGFALGVWSVIQMLQREAHFSDILGLFVGFGGRRVLPLAGAECAAAGMGGVYFP